MLTPKEKSRIVGLAMEIRRASYACGYVEGKEEAAKFSSGKKGDEKRAEMEQGSSKLNEYLEEILQK